MLCDGYLRQLKKVRSTEYSSFKQVVGGRPLRYAPLLPHGRRSAFRRRADGNVAAVSHGQHVLTPTAAAAWCANTEVSKAAWWPWPLTFDLESGVPVTHDVGYLCVNFGIPRRLSVLDLGPMYATDRQTDVRGHQTKASLNAPAY